MQEVYYVRQLGDAYSVQTRQHDLSGVGWERVCRLTEHQAHRLVRGGARSTLDAERIDQAVPAAVLMIRFVDDADPEAAGYRMFVGDEMLDRKISVHEARLMILQGFACAHDSEFDPERDRVLGLRVDLARAIRERVAIDLKISDIEGRLKQTTTAILAPPGHGDDPSP